MKFNSRTVQGISNNVFKKIALFISFAAIAVTFSAVGKPKTQVFYRYTPDGYAQVQIQNETSTELACWIAIDGFKNKFRLPPATTSKWITASDKRFTYSNFSTWCDYIELYPQYRKYSVGGSVLG